MNDLTHLGRKQNTDLLGLLSMAALFSDLGDSFVPTEDVADISAGAQWIPGDVTEARRKGQTVTFVANCGACCWFWMFPNGDRIYHHDKAVFNQIASLNGMTPTRTEMGVPIYEDSGRCPLCGNAHTRGGRFKACEV